MICGGWILCKVGSATSDLLGKGAQGKDDILCVSANTHCYDDDEPKRVSIISFSGWAKRELLVCYDAHDGTATYWPDLSSRI